MAKKSKRKSETDRKDGTSSTLPFKDKPSRGIDYPILHTIAFWGLAVILFLPPFFRGLFFPSDQQKFLLLAILVYWIVWIWKWFRRDPSFLSHPMDYCVFALPLIYIMSAFNSVNNGMAIDDILKAVLYFTVYWCVVQLSRSRKDAGRMLIVIYISGLGVALAGLMTAAGLLNIRDGMQYLRIASTLQYPNALASYLLVVLIVGIYLWWKYIYSIHIQSNKYARFLSYLLAIGNYLLAAVIIGTKSNGGIFVFAFAAVLLVIFIPGRNRILVLLHLAIITTASALGIHFFVKEIKVHQLLSWIYMLTGAFSVSFLQWFLLKLIPIAAQQKRRTLYSIIAVGLICVLILCSAFFLLNSNKFENIVHGIKLYSLIDRYYFVEDAFKMIKERPLLGWGGGGWKEAYQSYQSYSYISRQVHSYPVQVAVETGIIGLFAVFGIWLSFLLAGHRAYRKSENIEEKAPIIFLSVGIISLFIHAFVDFDLSLSAISIVLYTLMAVIRNMDKGQVKPKYKEGLIKTVAVLAASTGAIVFVLISLIITADNYANNSSAFLKQRNIEKAIISMEKASLYNPFKAEYHGALAELYMYSGQKDNAKNQAMESYIRSKYNAVNKVLMARLAFDQGNYNDAARYAEEAIKLAPWVISYYEHAGTIYKSAGLAELKNNRPSQASKFFAAASELPGRIKEKINSLDQERLKRNVNFDVTSNILLAAGVGSLFGGDINEAGNNLMLASNDQNTKGEALVWLSILSEKKGDGKSALEYLDKAKKISAEYENIYKQFKQLELENKNNTN